MGNTQHTNTSDSDSTPIILLIRTETYVAIVFTIIVTVLKFGWAYTILFGLFSLWLLHSDLSRKSAYDVDDYPADVKDTPYLLGMNTDGNLPNMVKAKSYMVGTGTGLDPTYWNLSKDMDGDSESDEEIKFEPRIKSFVKGIIYKNIPVYLPYVGLDTVAMRKSHSIDQAEKVITDVNQKLSLYDGSNANTIMSHCNNVHGLVAGSVSDGHFGELGEIGALGEVKTALALSEIAKSRPNSIEVFHDLFIPDGLDGTGNVVRSSNHANIDHIVVIGNHVIPVDSKNYRPGTYVSNNDNAGRTSDTTEKSFIRPTSDTVDRSISDTITKSNTFPMIKDKLDKTFAGMDEVTVDQPIVVIDTMDSRYPIGDLSCLHWNGAIPMTLMEFTTYVLGVIEESDTNIDQRAKAILSQMLMNKTESVA